MAEVLAMSRAEKGMAARDITNALQRFAEVRNGTLRQVARLTDEQASYVPAPGTWSVAQNLDHVLLTEAVYLSQIRRMVAMARSGGPTDLFVSLNEGGLKVPFIPERLIPFISTPLTMMNMLVPSAVRETILRFPIVKAKHPKMLDPAASKPIALLREELAASAKVASMLLSDNLPRNIGRITLTHPLFGRNTIANVLGLTAAHEERHGTQIGRLLRQPGFPEE